MRILFLSRWYPFPADNGSKIRIYNLIKELARRNDIWLVSFAEEQIDVPRIEGMRALCRGVDIVQYRRFNPGGAKAALSLLASKPRSVIDTFSPELQARVEALADQNPFDCVVASQIDMAPYALAVKGVPRILEEIEISIYAEQARRAEGVANKLRKHLMWRKWQNHMRDTLAHYDGCTVVSQPEIAPIQAAAPSFDRIAVIPNGADLEKLTGNFGKPMPDRLVYTGALTYYVNLDAMKFFISQVLPSIVAQRPQAKLLMAGRLDGVPLHELPKSPAATHAGYQKDIRPFVASGWASVVPERIGGGTRIKVVESMALGTPVVATKWATLGLDVTQGRDILFSDDPAELAQHIINLLRDATLRATLSQNARKLVETHYNWRVIGEQFEAFIERVVAKGPMQP